MGMEIQREVCETLPLADVVLRLGQFVLSEQHLSDVFEMHRRRSYEKGHHFSAVYQSDRRGSART